MASTTKIMTAVIAIEHGHLQDRVRISHAAATIGQSSMGLVEGERVRMHDLLYGLLLPSGNDAAIAIAEHIAGSVPKFVAMMNDRATQLHLTNTHYVTPFGFSPTPDGDDPAHHTSARDLVVLARYALQYPLFQQIVSTRSYVVHRTKLNIEHDLQTVNYFLNWYPGADGVKPGWTSGAGICQVVDIRRDGRHLLAAVLHTSNVFTDARDLMNYALGDFTWIPSHLSGDTTNQVVSSNTAGGRSLYFPYTGHGITGSFLRYFQSHGGFTVFGAPRTEVVNVDGDTEQYFSNQVLRFNQVRQVVTPEQLGYSALPARDWLAPVHRLANNSWRTYYAQTGHSVTYRFRAHYLALGGPRTFGYPISEKRYEGSTLVQYFENAEFVWHTDHGGYVAAEPLGLRRLVELGFAIGNQLPPPLHVPFTITAPIPSPRPIRQVTAPVEPSVTRVPATSSPTNTRIAKAPSPTSTARPSRTPTMAPTMRPSWTPDPTRTASPTRSPSPTETPSPTATKAQPSPSTPTPTLTPKPTHTPSPIPISSDTPSPPGSP
jgi:hypothetical protein